MIAKILKIQLATVERVGRVRTRSRKFAYGGRRRRLSPRETPIKYYDCKHCLHFIWFLVHPSERDRTLRKGTQDGWQPTLVTLRIGHLHSRIEVRLQTNITKPTQGRKGRGKDGKRWLGKPESRQPRETSSARVQCAPRPMRCPALTT